MKRSSAVLSACQIALALALAAGCAAQASEPAASPATVAEAPPGLVGVWDGALSGREFGTAAGPAMQAARLTVGPDATWTMHVAGVGRVAGRGVRVVGNAYELTGRVVEGSGPGPAGATVTYRLRPLRGGGLGGAADSFFSGHPVDSAIQLRKVS
jgi:hypothetical protein